MSQAQKAKTKINSVVEDIESSVVRIAGDSGDGIQLTGSRFTSEAANIGNDLSTLPNFPAEIRAPAGSIAGVSGFQIQFGSIEVSNPGDAPDVLVALNPAALKANLSELDPGKTLIVNEDAFSAKNLQKAGYGKDENPLEDGSLEDNYTLYKVPITRLTKEALVDTGLSPKEVDRCKNFFTLGVLLWLFGRKPDLTESWINDKFAKKPQLAAANIKALKAGIAFAVATEMLPVSYSVKPAKFESGLYRNINGTSAACYGFISASLKSKLPLFVGAYPITPASDILHELARHKDKGVTTFQAEDEIAAICASIGAAYCGSLAITSSSGPGISLKAEAIGLATIAELPLVIVNSQRGGPSTGLPTKTEQSDLFQALYGRHGECPVCVLAASDVNSAFNMAYEACRIATKYMTPVFLLTDGFINNSASPWKIPDSSRLTEFDINFCTSNNNDQGDFLPYKRDKKTLSRPWATPGTPGLEHRIGGLEKEHETGNVSYDPQNHEDMIILREKKIASIVQDVPDLVIDGEEKGEILVVGWGSTKGVLRETCMKLREDGLKISRIHIEHINPFPANLGSILKNFSKVVVPEINRGQLISVLRDRYLIDAIGYNSVKGLPLRTKQLKDFIKKL